MSSSESTISIVVPLHNEAENVPPLHDALLRAIKKLPYVFSFIFVDDGSTDETNDLLNMIAEQDERVTVLEFSRNFGKEAAVSAGLHAASGDAVIIMDADLQHPPSLIKQFIKNWENGADVVIGVREYTNKETALKRTTSAIYYKFINAISQTDITPHATDFRLMDRSVVEAFSELTERNRMTRGIVEWLGFKRDYIPFVAPPREHGTASYTYRKLVGLAMSSVTAYSLLPLKLAGYLGVIILLVSAPVGVFVFTEMYVMGDPYHLHISGTADLAIIILFLIGIVLTCLGLMALYIAQIHVEVTNRPLYVLRKRRTTPGKRKYRVASEAPVKQGTPARAEELEAA